jgi:hypothetical protein
MNINELSAIAHVCEYLGIAINNAGLVSKDDVKILVNKRNLLTKKFIELVKDIDVTDLFSDEKVWLTPIFDGSLFRKAKAEPVFVIAGQENDENLNIQDPVNVDVVPLNAPKEIPQEEKKEVAQDEDLLKRIAEEKATLKTKKKSKKD